MKKIAIIRFSSIGDIVLTTPVVRCLKKQLKEGVEIHYITKKTYSFLMDNNPYVDVVHSINSSVQEVLSELRKIDFDYVIDLHHNIRSFSLKKKIHAPNFTVDKLNIKKWFYVNFKWNILPKVHIVNRYMDTIKKLGIRNDNKGLDYFIPPQNEVDLKTLPEEFKSGFIAYGIGGQFEGKKMPIDNMIALISKINLPIVLLGGIEDNEVAEKVIVATKNSVFNGCGKYSFDQSASIVKQAQMVVSNDTGIMHIAAAFTKDIISLWGQTVPEFGMYPYLTGDKSRQFEPEGVRGRPISKLGNRKGEKQNIMQFINVHKVAQYINENVAK